MGSTEREPPGRRPPAFLRLLRQPNGPQGWSSTEVSCTRRSALIVDPLSRELAFRLRHPSPQDRPRSASRHRINPSSSTSRSASSPTLAVQLPCARPLLRNWTSLTKASFRPSLRVIRRPEPMLLPHDPLASRGRCGLYGSGRFGSAQVVKAGSPHQASLLSGLLRPRLPLLLYHPSQRRGDDDL